MSTLNMIAPMGYTGYGIAALNILKQLVKSETTVALFHKGNPSAEFPEDANIIKHAIDMQAFFDYEAPTLTIWHQFDLATSVGRGKKVAFPFFELNKFNAREKHHLGYPDTLIASSKWARDILAAETKHADIRVVPLGVDTRIWNTFRIEKGIFARNEFVIANVGKWEVRKGHDVLVEIFNKAFTKNDKVQLWMFPHNPFLQPEETQAWEDLYLKSDLGSKITIWPRQKTQWDLQAKLHDADIGIFPARAEGWNMELHEMMAMGKNVIATNYSAHTEYCTEHNCDLLHITEEEDAYDGKWFFGQGQWAAITDDVIDQAVEALRARYKAWKEYGYDEKFSASIPSNAFAADTASQLTWEKTTQLLKDALYD